MHSGRLVDVFNVKDEDIDIETIAHQLSMLCRFNGAVREFYSVAEHCVHLSYQVAPEYAAHALLHDASEAYFGDLVWPLKRTGHFEYFRDKEALLMIKIYAHFGLAPGEPVEVYTKDKEAAFHEGSALVPGFKPRQARPTLYPCWSPAVAREKYLARFKELFNGF